MTRLPVQRRSWILCFGVLAHFQSRCECTVVHVSVHCILGFIACMDCRTSGNTDIVITNEVRCNLAIVEPWFLNREPFILCGPLGCGKSTLIRAALSAMPSTTVAEMSCNAQTLGIHIIEKLLQARSMFVSFRQCIS